MSAKPTRTAKKAEAKPDGKAAPQNAAFTDARTAPAAKTALKAVITRPGPLAFCGPSKFLPFADLPAWLEELSESRTVYAPRREGAAVVYRPYAKGTAPELDARPTESAKHAIFPRSEELFRFRSEPVPDKPGTRRLTLEEPEVITKEPPQSVVFAALSCDARGFFAFDPVYDGCGTQGLAKDPYYLKRRANTALIVRACRLPLATCFCHWTGGGPAAGEGADVMATDLEDGLLLQPLSERGAALLTSARLTPADDSRQKAGEEARQAADALIGTLLGEVPPLEDAPKALLDLFDNLGFWQRQSAGCLSCGACTYLCPTCYCFNITDESNGLDGTRLRSWDTCMSALFTLEASGHNPRNGKAARLRNRVGHKFSYYPRLHEGRFSCCGCGRCIKSCPSSVDIRKIVQNALKEKNNG